MAGKRHVSPQPVFEFAHVAARTFKPVPLVFPLAHQIGNEIPF